MANPGLDAATHPFIVYNGPVSSRDSTLRTVVRKHVMQKIGRARKGKPRPVRSQMSSCKTCADPPNHASVHDVAAPAASESTTPLVAISGTRPVRSNDAERSDVEPEECKEGSATTLCDQVMTRHRARRKHADCDITASLSPDPEYERTRARFGVDIVDYAILTDFNVNKGTIKMLAAQPGYFSNLLRHEAWSYLRFVPSRYGRDSRALTASADCLLAKIATFCFPQFADAHARSRELYGEALRILQKALDNETSRLEASTLCAVQLLSLYELLDLTRDTEWQRHVLGSAALIETRRPEHFQSDFEKALFESHIGAIASEAMIHYRHCYLEKAEWIALYRSTIRTNTDNGALDNRSALTVNLRIVLIQVPGLWSDIHQLINSDRIFNDHAFHLPRQQCRDMHATLLRWIRGYNTHCSNSASSQAVTTSYAELSHRREILGTAMECLAVVKRLLATLCDEDRIELEQETQALAVSLMEMQKHPSPGHSWLFITHEIKVAWSIVRTTHEWCVETPVGQEVEAQRRATRRRYNDWSEALRPA